MYFLAIKVIGTASISATMSFTRNSSIILNHPSTSQPTPADFAKVYQELSKETDEIISIHLSGKLSGTYSSALQGKKLVDTKCNITVIDSESVTMGLGMLVMSAARLALLNEKPDKIMDEIKER